jgi:hypothetical protein
MGRQAFGSKTSRLNANVSLETFWEITLFHPSKFRHIKVESPETVFDYIPRLLAHVAMALVGACGNGLK